MPNEDICLQNERILMSIQKGSRSFKATNYSITTLMFAASNGKLETVKYLVEKGLDVNAKNKYGETALMFACRGGYMDVVAYLVDTAGADVNFVKLPSQVFYFLNIFIIQRPVII